MAATSPPDSVKAEPAPAPRGVSLVTVVVAISLFVGLCISFCLQVLLAIPTAPLLCAEATRELFYYLQSCTFRTTTAVTNFCLNPCWRTRLVRFGEKAGPQKGRVGSVIFCSHRTNADPWLVAQVQLHAGFEAKYVYKSMLGKVPLAGWSIRLAGDLAAHFGDKQQIKGMLERSRKLLLSGHNIVIFPEGTRSPSGLLQSFKPSFFQVCAEVGAPAVPLCLFGNESAWPHGGWKLGCATITAYLGEPLMAGDSGPEELSKQVAAAMRAMAGDALKRGFIGAEDPMVTDRPYTWWRVPKAYEELGEEEQLALLRAGKMHEGRRGRHLS